MLRGHESPIGYAKFSPDGKMVVTGAMPFDNTGRLWETTTGKPIATLAWP